MAGWPGRASGDQHKRTAPGGSCHWNCLGVTPGGHHRDSPRGLADSRRQARASASSLSWRPSSGGARRPRRASPSSRATNSTTATDSWKMASCHWRASCSSKAATAPQRPSPQHHASTPSMDTPTSTPAKDCPLWFTRKRRPPQMTAEEVGQAPGCGTAACDAGWPGTRLTSQGMAHPCKSWTSAHGHAPQRRRPSLALSWLWLTRVSRRRAPVRLATALG